MNRFVGISFFLLSLSSFAGVVRGLNHAAPTINQQVFEAGLQTDLVFNNGGGLNASAALKTGIYDGLLDGEVFLGSGKTDFFGGLNLKFNFLPDIPGQVGLSFLTNFAFVSDESTTCGLVGVAAIASRKYGVDFGTISPFGVFHTEYLFNSDGGVWPLNIAVGAEWEFDATRVWLHVLKTEFNFSLDDSLTYFSIAGGYRF